MGGSCILGGTGAGAAGREQAMEQTCLKINTFPPRFPPLRVRASCWSGLRRAFEMAKLAEVVSGLPRLPAKCQSV